MLYGLSRMEYILQFVCGYLNVIILWKIWVVDRLSSVFKICKFEADISSGFGLWKF